MIVILENTIFKVCPNMAKYLRYNSLIDELIHILEFGNLKRIRIV